MYEHVLNRKIAVLVIGDVIKVWSEGWEAQGKEPEEAEKMSRRGVIQAEFWMLSKSLLGSKRGKLIWFRRKGKNASSYPHLSN